MTAKDIQELLELKHSSDIYISECKNGGSDGGHLRMDGWAMKKSWANPLTIGYEIKVSRSDFIGDEKWPGYLQYCNQFNFVCPSGLIQPDEVSQGIGLMWVAKTGTRIYTKKKAAYRVDGVELEEVYKYILLWRSKVVDYYDSMGRNETKTQRWQRWLAEKDESKTIGHNVSKKVRQLVAERITRVETVNYQLEAENEKLQHVRDELKKLGFENGVPDNWYFDRQMEAMKEIVPKRFTERLHELALEIARVEESIEEIKNNA